MAVHRSVLLAHLGGLDITSLFSLAWCLGEQICEVGTGEEGGLLWWLCWPVSD